ncbi:MAG TPA: SUMF1/EgtB/PvdO family nonheme iron enzyme [Polyangiaceae bacterium]|nr:SUMF1/EgtB/PvdO family nonheme iron enzyme [Polyangiaceae bacterium]
MKAGPIFTACALATLCAGCEQSRGSADRSPPPSASPVQSVPPAAEVPSGHSATPAVAASASSSAAADRRALSTRGESVAAAPCPQEMVSVGRYCIDRWEAHLVRVGENGEESVHAHYERPVRGATYRAVSSPEVFPQAYVSRVESEAACRQAGKRLCTLGEWYRACHGPRGQVYPYGNHEERSRCNSGKPHLLSHLFGSNPSRWKYEEHFNSPRLAQEPRFLARTGEYAECVSGEGVMDLVGNLHEWVSDKVDSTLPAKVPLQEDVLKKVGPRTGHAIFMGGFFSTTSEHGRGCRFTTIGHEATYHDYSTGFRCCRDATP